MKNIKNYLILFLIFLITFVLCFYMFSWIKQYNDIKLKNSIVTDYLKEIKYNNLDNIIKENDMVYLYMCTSQEKVCKNFEKKFVTLLKYEQLTDNILYLNLDNKDIVNNIYKKYKHEYLIKKISYPVIVVFNNGRLVDFINIGENYDLNSIFDFLKGYGIND